MCYEIKKSRKAATKPAKKTATKVAKTKVPDWKQITRELEWVVDDATQGMRTIKTLNRNMPNLAKERVRNRVQSIMDTVTKLQKLLK